MKEPPISFPLRMALTREWRCGGCRAMHWTMAEAIACMNSHLGVYREGIAQ